MSMEAYYEPTGPAFSEFTEKRSRFLSDLFVVESEEEARAQLEAVRRQRHDARHHCWCCRLRAGGLERCSDDGEPQGTAGQPMLNVFQREDVTNVLCVVTRYFGGILLGAGGLTRAYSRAAKDALDAAGVSVQRLWDQVEIPCPYRLYERIRLMAAQHGGVVTDVDYGAGVTLRAMFAAEDTAAFETALTDLSGGQIALRRAGQAFRGFPVER